MYFFLIYRKKPLSILIQSVRVASLVTPDTVSTVISSRFGKSNGSNCRDREIRQPNIHKVQIWDEMYRVSTAQTNPHYRGIQEVFSTCEISKQGSFPT